MRIDGKEAYNIDRIVNGRAPHKLHKAEVQEHLKKLKDEEKVCVFKIDRTTWKGLD